MTRAFDSAEDMLRLERSGELYEVVRYSNLDSSAGIAVRKSEILQPPEQQLLSKQFHHRAWTTPWVVKKPSGLQAQVW